jgi:hypothetical protein
VQGVDAAVADNGLESVACPASGAQCTAVDLHGREVSFAPSTGHSGDCAQVYAHCMQKIGRLLLNCALHAQPA